MAIKAWITKDQNQSFDFIYEPCGFAKYNAAFHRRWYRTSYFAFHSQGIASPAPSHISARTRVRNDEVPGYVYAPAFGGRDFPFMQTAGHTGLDN